MGLVIDFLAFGAWGGMVFIRRWTRRRFRTASNCTYLGSTAKRYPYSSAVDVYLALSLRYYVT